jgi:hypothetical protein
MLPTRFDPAVLARTLDSSSPRHRHDHVSRRRFIGGTAALAGGAIGASVLGPTTALAKRASAKPRPIPGGFEIEGILFHVFGFGLGQEPSTITDFNGFIGVTDVQGTGTATYPDGSTETLLFDTDMRFMKGAFVGTDDRVHEGTFGFV